MVSQIAGWSRWEFINKQILIIYFVMILNRLGNKRNIAKDIQKHFPLHRIYIISGGTLDNTDGDSNKTSVKKHKSVKSEAHPSPLAWVGSSLGS